MTQPDGGQSPYDPPQQPEQSQPQQPYQGASEPPAEAAPGESSSYQQTPYSQAPQGPVYAQGGQPGPYGAAVMPKNNLGVWSLVLGILAVLGCGLLTGIAAIITGHKSRRATREGQADNGGMGLAGIITGWVGIVWTTVTVGFLVIGSVMVINDPSFQDGVERELERQYEQDLGDTGQTMDPELQELQDTLDQLENGS